MKPDWSTLNESERATVSTTLAFLHKRLAETSTIEWALQLQPAQRLERFAILDLLGRSLPPTIGEPWSTAWRLIEECWATEVEGGSWRRSVYQVQPRLSAGERSGSVIAAIAELVAPRLEVKTLSSPYEQTGKRRGKPKTFHDLLYASLASDDLVDLNVLGLNAISETQFLCALANALESAVHNGLEIARRLGWDGKSQMWKLGQLHSVRYSMPNLRDGEATEVDAYHHGIAPSVKLLHAVVARIAALDIALAISIIQRWKLQNTPIHLRLWAAMACDKALVSGAEAGAFLSNTEDNKFWTLHEFPELAELRMSRFADFDDTTKTSILKRLRRGEPRNHFSKRLTLSEFAQAKRYYAAREMQRIAVSGTLLPPKDKLWLEAQITDFPELANMSVHSDFPKASEAHLVPPNPDNIYNSLSGIARLQAMETALSTPRSWPDDPADRADDWLRLEGNASAIIGDLEKPGDGGSSFPKLWSHFGWEHSPKKSESSMAEPQDQQSEANRVLVLLSKVSDSTLIEAIEGITYWLEAWRKQVNELQLGLKVWLRLWPIAVEVTNSQTDQLDDTGSSITKQFSDGEREPNDSHTFSTPAGKLVGIFLSACPPLALGQMPFAKDSSAKKMRDAIENCSGKSNLIAKYRMIEAIDYFLQADSAWTQHHLVTPLKQDDKASLPLWRALAKRRRFNKVLEVAGELMAERAVDHRLGRETRSSLVFSLVIQSLHAFNDNKQPKVKNETILQMLRNLDDEVRSYAANSIQQFVRDHSTKQKPTDKVKSPTQLFRSAVAPFLQQVWPQERSLTTPSVSKAFADLPVTTGDAFAEAVAAIERFLVPFDCWSMVEYGLYGEDGGEKKLRFIDSVPKASAFLRLLDLTIGESERSVVPTDLPDALDQIRSVDSALAKTSSFRRLSTSARR
jgi:hypothetical protein